MRNSNSKMLAGLLLILIGLFALGGNLFGLPFHFTHYIFSLPGIIMLIGFFILMNETDSFLGLTLVGVGGILFLSRYSNIPVKQYLSEYWPILLIIFGISIIFKKRNHRYNNFCAEEINKLDLDYIDDTSVLSSGRKTINSQNFRGGKTTVVLGGNYIDLHEASLAEGTNALEITVLLGGIEIIVPRDWKVIINVTSIFGGVDDKRIVNANQVYENNKVLVISGTVLFGGCDIKTY